MSLPIEIPRDGPVYSLRVVLYGHLMLKRHVAPFFMVEQSIEFAFTVSLETQSHP
jgi:hypothetical protein